MARKPRRFRITTSRDGYPVITYASGHQVSLLRPVAGMYVMRWADRGEARQVFQRSGWAFEWTGNEKRDARIVRDVALRLMPADLWEE